MDDRRIELALWGLLGAGIVFLAVLGVLRGQEQSPLPEPLPVIAEVPEFELTHRDGRTVSLDDFRGQPWVADFIFTRCVAVCPRMSVRMMEVAEALGEESPVRLASFSVDPEHDTPEVLDTYAQRYKAGPNWYFLTGEAETLHRLTREGFLIALDLDPDPEIRNGLDPIVHSNRFVLVDEEARIRGYYDPFESGEVERLLGDLERLSP